MNGSTAHAYILMYFGLVAFALSLFVFWSAIRLTTLVHVSRVSGSENEPA